MLIILLDIPMHIMTILPIGDVINTVFTVCLRELSNPPRNMRSAARVRHFIMTSPTVVLEAQCVLVTATDVVVKTARGIWLDQHEFPSWIHGIVDSMYSSNRFSDKLQHRRQKYDINEYCSVLKSSRSVLPESGFTWHWATFPNPGRRRRGLTPAGTQHEITISSYRYGDSHYKDKMIVRPSFLKPIELHLYIETGPGLITRTLDVVLLNFHEIRWCKQIKVTYEVIAIVQ